MLVLSRQRDESIVIGNNIVVTIVDIRGDKVRLGIDAPSEIPVHRQEVFDAIQRENSRAGHEDCKGVIARKTGETAEFGTRQRP
jgi:carbon storage regulator